MLDPAASATRIYDFERKIAAVHWTRTQSADVAKANNHWVRADFDKKAPGIDWAALFDGAGLSAAQTFIVWQPDAIAGIARLVGSEPMPVWREYLSFHAVDHNLAVLPKAFADEGFAFYGKALNGTEKQRDRWKRAVDATNAALGPAVGKMYVAKYFPAQSKAQLNTIIVITDGHAPDEYRADTMRNLDAWYPAFDVKKGQRLYLDPPDRVRVW